MELVVKKQTVLYVLLIFPILKINYLLHFPLFTLIYQLILLFDLVYCVILYLKRKQTPAEFVVLFLLLEIWLYIQTYIKQGDIPEVMRVARSVICIAMIFDLFSNNIKSLMKCLYYYFFVFAVINLLLMILFPNGIYSVYSAAYSTNTREWLFGVGNVSISWHYPAVVVAWIYSTLLGNKKYGWYMSAVALISHLIDGSATTIVGILIILIIQNISFFKKMEYILIGDYYLPALKVPRTRPVGRWGMLHKAYLKLRKPAYYQSLLLNGKLDAVLADVEEQAAERYEVLIEQMSQRESISEKLKEENQMEWVSRMRNLENRAEEIVKAELIYTFERR